MARMYPQHFPEWALKDEKLSAEKKVYAALSTLPDNYTVFYHVAWQIRSLQQGVEDGEADFIIAHPNKGILILEVKGGQIHYDANLQQWYSKDRYGQEHPIKDPVNQLRRSKGAMISKLRELPSWGNRYINIAYSVVFPDVIAEKILIRPDLSRELIIDAVDLRNLLDKIEQTFDWFHRDGNKFGALGKQGIEILESFLANSITLSTPMGVQLEYEEQKIIELTEQQMALLQFIQRQRRALIEGCAGSGKTMLALEKARQLSEQGFATLLVCFNVPLAEYLREVAPQEVDVFHFHGLCTKLAKDAGLGYRSFLNDEDYYNNVLPEMLLEALENLGTQYDAIIVDEGQDFHIEWLKTLMMALHDGEKGIFYVFYDNNQNIYHRLKDLDNWLKIPPFILNENCRNTQSIHNVVKEFHTASNELVCYGPVGLSPEVYFFSNSAQQEEIVRKSLDRLVNTEKVEPRHITLLTTRAPEHTIFNPGRKLGNFILREWSDKTSRHIDIRVSSTSRFKGLENRVVILTGLEDSDAYWINEILYVACSRARTYLIIVAHERSKSLLEKILPSTK
ncbi:nuclease-related domain/AAA domain [Bellilinea caldifistulae]|uniref:NERD domain-containing protein n=1 Tax=Bellilinea caldifistulae TaxID=360411 RepID=A0A0P6XPB4_9CHLR|nr:NERD domain-containing protein/DEAD/DEAH box helicase [Bellilinea caldifistulae]KPL70933.1 hypothetical protein AC812_16545 [Bellilinea caldifistulae]GAP11865.1 nuclease-related domain/AAA domain [Bellilinea caldifistulae]